MDSKWFKIFSSLAIGSVWILTFPVAVAEGVPAWRRWISEIVVLYQILGPWALLIPSALTLAWWLYWYPPKRVSTWAGGIDWKDAVLTNVFAPILLTTLIVGGLFSLVVLVTMAIRTGMQVPL